MKILFGLLALSIGVALVAILATWWRLRQHLRRSDQGLQETLLEVHSEQESVEQR